MHFYRPGLAGQAPHFQALQTYVANPHLMRCLNLAVRRIMCAAKIAIDLNTTLVNRDVVNLGGGPLLREGRLVWSRKRGVGEREGAGTQHLENDAIAHDYSQL